MRVVREDRGHSQEGNKSKDEMTCMGQVHDVNDNINAVDQSHQKRACDARNAKSVFRALLSSYL